MHTTRRDELFAALRDGHDFSLVIRFLVMAMGGFNLVHLNGLGNTDADFCFSPNISRAATGHIETVHASGVHLFAQGGTRVKRHHKRVSVDAALRQGEEEVKIGVYARGEDDDIDDTEDGTDGAGLDRGSDQAFNDVVGLPETSFTSPKEVEKRQRDANVDQYSN